MNVYRVKTGSILPLGKQGENLARKIQFDVSRWISTFGPGTVQLLHQRSGDEAPYPVAVYREGNFAVWTVTDADTAAPGTGHAELQYYVGDALAKSETWMTKVFPALGDAGETPPEAQQINTLSVDDQMAYRMREFYPAWSDIIGQTAEKAGYKFTYNGDLYKTIPANHTFAAQWVPGDGTESLYTRIDETHDGSRYDPIPYEGNMALVSGKYYSQDGVTYLCSRDTVSPVYHALRELVGIYVEEVNG